ncbi:hypothetical protein ACFLZH_00445 [Patescibacteria group bacterium]
MRQNNVPNSDQSDDFDELISEAALLGMPVSPVKAALAAKRDRKLLEQGKDPRGKRENWRRADEEEDARLAMDLQEVGITTTERVQAISPADVDDSDENYAGFNTAMKKEYPLLALAEKLSNGNPELKDLLMSNMPFRGNINPPIPTKRVVDGKTLTFYLIYQDRSEFDEIAVDNEGNVYTYNNNGFEKKSCSN